MNLGHIFRPFFRAVYKFSPMQKDAMITHMFLIFSTLLKYLEVPHFSIVLITFFCLLGKVHRYLGVVLNTGTLDEHMHLLLPALIRLFKVDASMEIRRAAIKTLTRLIPRVQVGHQNQTFLMWLHITYQV